MNNFVFDIDVVGACNLRCRSCPQGSPGEFRLPQGRMSPALLARILDKALAECTVERVNLFNWCEPLLHPRVHELVGVVQERGIRCYLSSNLNLLPDPDSLMAANPAGFKISVSGFTQEVYGRFHRGGDIERVKEHMVRLAQAKQRRHASTRIVVNFHRYRDNLAEEPLMREFARGLGFEFEPCWALMLPLERVLAPPEPDAGGAPLAGPDADLTAQLALPLHEALQNAREGRGQPCPLREHQISMDFRGMVQLCCGTFDSGRYTVANYLEVPLPEIQRIRAEHPLCRRCMADGAHLYLTYRTPGLEELALEHLAAQGVETGGLRREMARQRRRLWLGQMCGRVLSAVLSESRKAGLKLRLRRVAQAARPARRPPVGEG